MFYFEIRFPPILEKQKLRFHFNKTESSETGSWVSSDRAIFHLMSTQDNPSWHTLRLLSKLKTQDTSKEDKVQNTLNTGLPTLKHSPLLLSNAWQPDTQKQERRQSSKHKTRMMAPILGDGENIVFHGNFEIAFFCVVFIEHHRFHHTEWRYSFFSLFPHYCWNVV